MLNVYRYEVREVSPYAGVTGILTIHFEWDGRFYNNSVTIYDDGIKEAYHRAVGEFRYMARYPDMIEF